MIIVGAKGFAKELLQIVSVDLSYVSNEILFFDNVSKDLPQLLFNEFKILKSFDEVKNHFLNSNDKKFVLGLGNPKYRNKLYNEFITLGAIPISLYSNKSEIGAYDVSIGKGTAILAGAIISNSVSLGKGCLVYYNSVITHDCIIGDFVEISPGVKISGRCTIGNNTRIGANATILPDIIIGSNVTIGAGAVILNNVPDNVVIVGVPGRIINSNYNG